MGIPLQLSQNDHNPNAQALPRHPLLPARVMGEASDKQLYEMYKHAQRDTLRLLDVCFDRNNHLQVMAAYPPSVYDQLMSVIAMQIQDYTHRLVPSAVLVLWMAAIATHARRIAADYCLGAHDMHEFIAFKLDTDCKSWIEQLREQLASQPVDATIFSIQPDISKEEVASAFVKDAIYYWIIIAPGSGESSDIPPLMHSRDKDLQDQLEDIELNTIARIPFEQLQAFQIKQTGKTMREGITFVICEYVRQALSNARQNIEAIRERLMIEE